MTMGLLYYTDKNTLSSHFFFLFIGVFGGLQCFVGYGQAMPIVLRLDPVLELPFAFSLVV